MNSDSEHHEHHAGRKRLRATQACVICRKKKIKCDGTKPECNHCRDSNTQCEYTESKKRGPRKGYVQMLEERLAQMERRIIQLGGPSALPVVSETDINHSTSPRNGRSLSKGDDNLPPKETIMHLVELFFKHINSVFPIVHRATLIKQIEDGTVSRPLLWSVLAIGARYSDDHNIKTDPPYWAGERFAAKATALIDGGLLEPTLPNLQFWGIMACLEYGRASGAKAWIYAGLAVRFCQELGLNKEETLSTPILSKDGTVDTVAMAMRRRIFWSCLAIDKFSSAGTNRPQGFQKIDVDANPPNIPESLVLRDPSQNVSVSGKPISSNKQTVNDSLLDATRHYLKIVKLFGEVNSIMNRAKSDSSCIVWPPVPEYNGLDTSLRNWRENLPDHLQFTTANVEKHKDHAGLNSFNTWLSMHAVWCSSLMVLHRGSLAYGDIRSVDVDPGIYRAIQSSIETCKVSVRTATGVFRAMRDLCGANILPFMGYSAYVFATVLMTSTFSKGPEACRRSSTALRILYDLIDSLKPYWPMCERLANTASDLLVAHSRLYQPTSERQGFPYDSQDNSTTTALYSQPAPPQPSSSSMLGTPPTSNTTSSTSSTPNDISYNTVATLSHAPPPTSAPAPMEQNTITTTAPPPELSQQSFQSILASDFSNSQQLNIDFDSLDFLNDSALFGQIMFDARPNMVPNTLSNAFAYPTMQNFTPDTTTASPMQGYVPPPPQHEAWNTQ
ncbi:hypothetical protein LRAMOSA00090 [Lichtheimia ramosa]|uniref:Zn(2)-C6 fungal-type domain-containing protein n=1 Tax=Lichtheimia ramosa TaxID=688394 RepID=A0A077W783_9FUNG|nr:hypothetical protein LRAMOSA00090 [Lichtheimia ramosa]